MTIRRYDPNDDEMHKNLVKEICEDSRSPEEKLRAGDPAAKIEIVSKAEAASSEAASSSSGGPSGVSQIIGETISQFLKPETRDQGTE